MLMQRKFIFILGTIIFGVFVLGYVIGENSEASLEKLENVIIHEGYRTSFFDKVIDENGITHIYNGEYKPDPNVDFVMVETQSSTRVAGGALMKTDGDVQKAIDLINKNSENSNLPTYVVTQSILFQNEYHYITYQTNEKVVDSVKFHTDGGSGENDYRLEFSISPKVSGEISVIIPSLDSDIFSQNYCLEFNNTSESHFYFFLIDGQEALVGIPESNSKTMNVIFPYTENTKLIEIILTCHI